MLTDVIFGAARAGLLIGKVKQDIEKVIASPSLFVFDPVRQKIDGNIDQSKIAKSGLELRATPWKKIASSTADASAWPIPPSSAW